MKRKPNPPPPALEDGEKLYTIDELSAKTGVPSRTIRFYQGKGALERPMKKGRVAYYNEEHVERLELVALLQDRGINLRTIAELVTLVDSNTSVSEWLGLGETLQASWTDDQSVILTEDELRELIGPSPRAGMIVELEKTELIQREGTTRPARYLVSSPGMLKIGIKLKGSGFDLMMAKAAGDLMRKRLGKMVDELVQHFRIYLTDDMPLEELKKLDPAQIGNSVKALRGIWLETTRLILAQEIERATHALFEKGKMLPSRRDKKRTRRGRR
ncbi:MAG: MerR family transcriptional regulator [Proteobacteria bacterium]|nr:MerR family transcriptional regulator [Pseudomonadota bacterium]